jgi:hypothetical protein
MQKSKPIKVGDLVKMVRAPHEAGIVIDIQNKPPGYTAAVVQWPDSIQCTNIGLLENLSGRISIT